MKLLPKACPRSCCFLAVHDLGTAAWYRLGLNFGSSFPYTWLDFTWTLEHLTWTSRLRWHRQHLRQPHTNVPSGMMTKWNALAWSVEYSQWWTQESFRRRAKGLEPSRHCLGTARGYSLTMSTRDIWREGGWAPSHPLVSTSEQSV